MLAVFILFVIITFIMFFIHDYNKNNNDNNDNSTNNKIENKPGINRKIKSILKKNKPDDNHVNALMNSLTKQEVGKYFINTSVDNEYRDVISALHNLCPNQQKIFNMQALPVINEVCKRKSTEVNELVIAFIIRLNKEIENLKCTNDIINVYNNVMPMTDELVLEKQKRGIEKYYDEVGVTYGLYTTPPVNSPVELIDILSVKKEVTEFETRYLVKIVIKKIVETVEKQMALTVYFVVRNDPLCQEIAFNRDKMERYDVIIEYIFVDGFYTNTFNSNYECYGRDHKDTNKPFVEMDGGIYYNLNKPDEEGITSNKDILSRYNRLRRIRDLEKIEFQ